MYCFMSEYYFLYIIIIVMNKITIDIQLLLNNACVVKENIPNANEPIGFSFQDQGIVVVPQEILYNYYCYFMEKYNNKIRQFSPKFVTETIKKFLLDNFNKSKIINESDLLKIFEDINMTKYNVLINLYNIGLEEGIKQIILPSFELHNPQNFLNMHPHPLLLPRLNEQNKINPDNARQLILILKDVELYINDSNAIESIIEEKSSEIIKFISVALGDRNFAQSLTTNFSHNSMQYHLLDNEYNIINSSISASRSSFLGNQITLLSNFTNEHQNLFELLVDHNNELKQKIYKAALWLGKSIQTKDLEDSFLQVAISLECLLSRQEKGYFIQPSITTNLAETLSFIITKEKEKRIKTYKKLKQFYGMRSSIVHSGGSSSKIKSNDYIEFFNFVKLGIYSMLNIIKQDGFDKINELYNLVEDKKFA